MAKKKYYVSMTDEFLSGWGKAVGKIDKLVIVCDSSEEAQIVARNARDRSEMTEIVILTKKPHYSPVTHCVSYHEKPEYLTWFKKDRPFLNLMGRR